MYLKEIIINGFKSFPNRTRVQLSPGITMIVGPNGCGKSNIVDAVRWVLGEKSAKSLRGGKMQDVIFEGTDKRKPLPICEVSLTFGNCESALKTDFNEVEVSRRVARDGNSDYLLNGKHCRLKDIQQLFMDTGVGRTSYSFMVQGQVDQILSENPAERRAIFEEASGITKYKSQRNEALNKLLLVDQNLARITDIIEEISRQMGSLKRQANKALRYKQIKSRLKYLELAHNGYQFNQFNNSVEALSKNADSLRAAVLESQQTLQQKETDLNQKKSSRSEQYEKIQEVQQTVYDLRSAKEQAEQQAELAGLRREDLKNRIDTILDELQELNAQRETLTRQAADSSEHKQRQLVLFDASGDTFQTKSNDLLEIEKKVEKLESELEEEKQGLLISEGEMVRLRSNCTNLEVDLKTYQVKHANLTQNRFKLENEHVEIENQLEELKKNLSVHQREREREEQSLLEDRKETNRIRDDFRNLQREIQDADRALARQTAQLHILEELQKKFEGFSEGTKAILQGKLADLLPVDACYLLTEQLQIEPQFTQAFETLLGSAVDSIIVDNPTKIIPTIEQLNTQELGRACLQIAVPPCQTDPTGKERPEWLRPASEVVHPKREDLHSALTALLKDCYFCDNLERFLEYWKSHPGFHFLLVATQQGERVDRRGLVYGGHVKGDDNTFLQRTIEIQRLKEALRKHQKTVDGLHEQAQQLQDKLEKSDVQVENRHRQLVEIERTLSTLQAEERGALKKLEQNNAEQKSGEQELKQFELSGQQSTDRLEQAKAAMAKVENRIEHRRLAIKTLEDTLVKTRQNRDIHRDAISEVRVDVAEKKQGLALIDQGLEDIQQQLRTVNENSVQREQEKDSIHEQIKALEEEEQAQRIKATEFGATLKTTMDSVEKDREMLLSIENQIQTLETSLNSEHARQRDLEQALNKLEVQRAQQQTQTNFITEKIHNDYQIDIAEVNWKEALWKAETLHNRKKESFQNALDRPGDEAEEDLLNPELGQELPEPTDKDYRAMDTTDWATIEAEIKKIRDRLASMGPVNLVAIEEYNTLQKRYTFLKNQSEDLWNSKNELVRAIDEINKTSRELFETTFEQIRKNFRYTFDHLFGGGFADLSLVDPQETLDSGIEITARPPGTKLRGISLLSGGQKAMTAVALLFAIYRVKPSPICVLDELDAPLDDANIGRFTKILSQFTQYSQFIVVSHNKRTIAAADTIYGVTMQERGVTELISVRFDHEKKSIQGSETEQTEATAIDA